MHRIGRVLLSVVVWVVAWGASMLQSTVVAQSIALSTAWAVLLYWIAAQILAKSLSDEQPSMSLTIQFVGMALGIVPALALIVGPDELVRAPFAVAIEVVIAALVTLGVELLRRRRYPVSERQS